MRAGTLVALAVLAPLVSGCDPSYSVSGSVVARGSGTALEGVEIRVTCPKGHVIQEKTNSSGRFELRGPTGIVPSDACVLTAKKAGFSDGRTAIEACDSQWMNCKRSLDPIELWKSP